MCGRFTLTTDSKQLAESFATFEAPADLSPRYNIAPSQPIAVVANNDRLTDLGPYLIREDVVVGVLSQSSVEIMSFARHLHFDVKLQHAVRLYLEPQLQYRYV